MVHWGHCPDFHEVCEMWGHLCDVEQSKPACVQESVWVQPEGDEPDVSDVRVQEFSETTSSSSLPRDWM